MGMSTHITGFRPPDKEWEGKAAAFRACEEAGVDPPKELWRFFGFERPDDNGVSVDLTDAITEYDNCDGQHSFEVDLSKVPSQLTHIRFVNSY